jgi:hypothetical protein
MLNWLFANTDTVIDDSADDYVEYEIFPGDEIIAWDDENERYVRGVYVEYWQDSHPHETSPYFNEDGIIHRVRIYERYTTPEGEAATRPNYVSDMDMIPASLEYKLDEVTWLNVMQDTGVTDAIACAS